MMQRGEKKATKEACCFTSDIQGNRKALSLSDWEGKGGKGLHRGPKTESESRSLRTNQEKGAGLSDPAETGNWRNPSRERRGNLSLCKRKETTNSPISKGCGGQKLVRWKKAGGRYRSNGGAYVYSFRGEGSMESRCGERGALSAVGRCLV